MAINFLGESNPQGSPEAGRAEARALSREAPRGAGPPDAVVGGGAAERAWDAWVAKGRGSARPPWWVLLLGLLALSVVYWLWGRGPGATL